MTSLAEVYSTSVFDYDRRIYADHYRQEHMAKFCHDQLAKGVIGPEEGRKIVSVLNHLAPSVAKSISFDQKMIASQLVGEACTVISLQAAKEVFKTMAEQEAEQDLNEDSKDKVFILGVRKIMEKMSKEACSSKAKYKERRKQIRTIQQAFNTITVDRDLKVENIVQEKMKALAAYYHLKVTHSTSEIEINDCDFQSKLDGEIKALKSGVYLMRIIKYKNNHKLEEHGHTVIYIKTERSTLYFDVALGLYQLFNESKKTHLIYNSLLSAKLRFGVDRLSFHQLELRE